MTHNPRPDPLNPHEVEVLIHGLNQATARCEELVQENRRLVQRVEELEKQLRIEGNGQ